jgi:hypothetical protein
MQIPLSRESIMRLHQTPQGTACDSGMNDEDDREFRDFVESVSVSKEELAAMVGLPEFSPPREANKDAKEEKVPPNTNAAVALRAFQRRFHRQWKAVAAAFVATNGPEYHARSPRKS